MKKLFWMLSIALLPMVAFTSCSDDDNDTHADSVKGTYAVYLNAPSLGIINDAGSITLKKTGHSTVSLALTGFKFTGVNIEGVAIKRATITGSKGNSAISSAEETISVKIGESTIDGVKVQVVSGVIKSKTDTSLSISVKIPELGDYTILATSKEEPVS